MAMNMDQWWNDADRGNLKYSEKNLSHCHFVHHKSHIDYCVVDARPHSEKLVPNHTSYHIVSPVVVFPFYSAYVNRLKVFVRKFVML